MTKEIVLFTARHASDNGLVERWIRPIDIKRLYKLYRADGWEVSFRALGYIAGFVRVAPDPSDASRDYYIPAGEARRLFESGKLDQDATNSKPDAPVYTPRPRRS